MTVSHHSASRDRFPDLSRAQSQEQNLGPIESLESALLRLFETFLGLPKTSSTQGRVMIETPPQTTVQKEFRSFRGRPEHLRKRERVVVYSGRICRDWEESSGKPLSHPLGKARTEGQDGGPEFHLVCRGKDINQSR